MNKIDDKVLTNTSDLQIGQADFAMSSQQIRRKVASSSSQNIVKLEVVEDQGKKIRTSRQQVLQSGNVNANLIKEMKIEIQMGSQVGVLLGYDKSADAIGVHQQVHSRLDIKKLSSLQPATDVHRTIQINAVNPHQTNSILITNNRYRCLQGDRMITSVKNRYQNKINNNIKNKSGFKKITSNQNFQVCQLAANFQDEQSFQYKNPNQFINNETHDKKVQKNNNNQVLDKKYGRQSKCEFFNIHQSAANATQIIKQKKHVLQQFTNQKDQSQKQRVVIRYNQNIIMIKPKQIVKQQLVEVIGANQTQNTELNLKKLKSGIPQQQDDHKSTIIKSPHKSQNQKQNKHNGAEISFSKQDSNQNSNKHLKISNQIIFQNMLSSQRSHQDYPNQQGQAHRTQSIAQQNNLYTQGRVANKQGLNKTSFKYFICQICCQQVPESQKITLKCTHSFCQQCLIKCAVQNIKQYKTLTCPISSCRCFIHRDQVTYLSKLPINIYKKYLRYLNFMNNRDREETGIVCPDEDCDQGILQVYNQQSWPVVPLQQLYKRQKHKLKQTIQIEQNPPFQKLKCSKCQALYCKRCLKKLSLVREPSAQIQNRENTEQFINQLHYQRAIHKNCKQWRQQFNQILDTHNFRKCHRCQQLVEKTKGCNHMTCKCGYQFCFHCGNKWKFTHLCNPFKYRLKYNNKRQRNPSSLSAQNKGQQQQDQTFTTLNQHTIQTNPSMIVQTQMQENERPTSGQYIHYVCCMIGWILWTIFAFVFCIAPLLIGYCLLFCLYLVGLALVGLTYGYLALLYQSSCAECDVQEFVLCIAVPVYGMTKGTYRMYKKYINNIFLLAKFTMRMVDLVIPFNFVPDQCMF